VLGALCGILLGLVLSVFAGEAPHDTVLARYIVTYVDTACYQTVVHNDGHRSVSIGCPGEKPLLIAEIWPEDLAEYRILKQAANINKEEASDAKGLIRELDSLLSARKKKP